MGVLVQDSARNNLVSWTLNGLRSGYLEGAILSPFTSPLNANGFKRSASDTSGAIRDQGGEFWLDPMTHAFNMPRSTDFRFYDEWSLWPSRRGDLSTESLIQAHIERVFAAQVSLSSPHMAPTVLVSYPDSPRSQLALEMARIATEFDATTWLSVAGDQQFWSAGAELDAHIGALDQLEPGGWIFTVTRGDNSMPPSSTPDEVFGLMRSSFALSADRPVRIAFGDIAGIPAIAAGAESLGTGWDMRQRICAYQDFEERAGDTGGGSWYQRPTLSGLVGSLTSREFSVLQSENATLASRLAPGTIGPQPERAFRHHATLLTGIINELAGLDGRDRVVSLYERYERARVEWRIVEQITGAKTGASRWITPFQTGVRLFLESEGWI